LFEHGFCILWNKNLIIWSIITNSAIAIAYFLIPLILWSVAKSTDFKIPKSYKKTLLMFASFIFFCGSGHLLDIMVIWFPWYWTKIVWDGLTALTSLITVFNLYPLAKRFIILVDLETSENKL